MSKLPSVLILTLNEEIDLPGCLASVAWCDDVVVFDSLSTDRTREIAEAAGARFIERRFDDYASQRNAALHGVEYRHPWVLMVDADERVSGGLREEIAAALAHADDSVAMFRMRRKDMFLGRWLRHSSGYPVWFGRLVRPDRVTVEREINEEYHADGQVRSLREHLIHYPFSKGLGCWFERHNRYSTMEAELLARDRGGALSLRGILCGDPVERRKQLKHLAYRMPLRPFLVFVYLYFVRLGLLDGRAGVTYCALRSLYEYMIDVKAREIRESGGGRRPARRSFAGGETRKARAA